MAQSRRVEVQDAVGGRPEREHTERRTTSSGLAYQEEVGEIALRSLTATGAAAFTPTRPVQGAPSGLPTQTTVV